MLGAPGPILQPDIKPTKRPVEDRHGRAHYQRKNVISNSLLPYAFPKVALRELQVNVWVIFLVVNDYHDYVDSASPVASWHLQVAS